MSGSRQGKMKAVRWEGKAFNVSVKDIDIPKITQPLDAIVRLTSAAICGTDLHTYHGRLEMNHPLTFGHENLGIVEDVGSGITTLKRGDRVVVASTLEEATDNGELELFGGLGVGDYGGGTPQLNGGQAEYVRVPFANVNLLLLPPGDEHELDYLLLADIWPTAWWALDCAGQVLGDTVVVFGAGPVGLLCAYSAILRGAIRVYSVDHVPERLAKAKSIGAIPINFMKEDPVAALSKLEPNGVDRSCDCVGFECVNTKGENIESTVISWAVNVTRPGGGVGLIGVYDVKDLGALNAAEAQGIIPIPVGVIWLKGLTIKGGPVQLRLYQELLKTLIESGKGKPSFVFDKEFSIEEGADAFREFSDHKIIKAVFRFDAPSDNVNGNGKRKSDVSESPRRKAHRGQGRGGRTHVR